MNLQQAKILLEKINSLFKSIDMDQGEMAGIERDLMLSYLRQLYEIFQEQGNPVEFQKRSADAGNQERQNSVSTDRRPSPEPLQRTYKPPRIIEIPDAEKETTGKEASGSPEEKSSSGPPAPEKTVQPKAEPTRPRPEPRQPASNDSVGSPEIEALFEQRRATELSEKLSESPVGDLTKSMAINDRLLYMNELFDKNMNALDENLRQLNRYSSMEAAKPQLVKLARRYDWTDEERMETAKSFIKLVRRRYL